MKKTIAHTLYITTLLITLSTQANKTNKKLTNKKSPRTKISHTKRRHRQLTNEFICAIQAYSPQVKGKKRYETIVKNRLRTHLINSSPRYLETRVDGKTALFLAVEYACKEAQSGNDIQDYMLIIRRLLDKGADINTRNDNDWQTPLHVAAHYQNEKIITLLRAYGAQNRLQDIDGKTPFDLIKDSQTTVDLILATFKKESLPKTSIKHTRARLAHEKLMTVPHNKNIKIYKQNKKSAPLFIAVECGMLHHLLALLGSKENTSRINTQLKNQPYNKQYTGITPLHLAVLLACQHAKKGNQTKYATYKQIIEALLTHDANIHAQTNLHRTPLHIAAQCNNPNVVQLLLTYGADTLMEDYKNKTAYELCSERKTKRVLRTWNGPTKQPECTITMQKRKIAQEFLQNIPKIYNLKKYKNKEDAEVHIAAITGAKEHLRHALCQANITSINTKIKGETPLIAGIKEYFFYIKHNAQRRLKTIKFLLRKGANINASDKNGNTPLHLALKQNDKKLVKVLYTYNPDVLKKNKKGKSPLTLAEKLKDKTLYQELKALIATQETQTSPLINSKTTAQSIEPSAPIVETHKGCTYARNLYPLIEVLEEPDEQLHVSQQSTFNNPFSYPTQEQQNNLTLSNMLPDVNELDPIPHAKELTPVYEDEKQHLLANQ